MRFISFQSKDVVDILLSGKTYVPDITKCRVDSPYTKDGGPKVWMFYLDINRLAKLMSGSLFISCRSEMSLWEDDFVKLYMIELEVDEKLCTVGLTHNACDWAMVTPTISIDNVISVYRLFKTPLENCVNAGRIYLNKPKSVFPSYIDVFNHNVHRDEWYTGVHHPDCTIGEPQSCTCCEVETKYYYKGKYPMCSGDCLRLYNMLLTDSVPKQLIESVAESFHCSLAEALQRIKSNPRYLSWFS